MNVADQLKKLDEQRAEILEKAKKELLEKAAAAIDELNSLGFSYGLIEGKSQVKKATGKKARNTDPAKKHCPICDADGHDGRAHRGQGKTKKKFTAAELKELGLA